MLFSQDGLFSLETYHPRSFWIMGRGMDATRISDILFEDVSYYELPSYFNDLVIRHATADEIQEITKKVDLPENTSPTNFYTLEIEGLTFFVVASRFYIQQNTRESRSEQDWYRTMVIDLRKSLRQLRETKQAELGRKIETRDLKENEVILSHRGVFAPWSFTGSHHMLLIRGKGVENGRNIDIIFGGVFYHNLPTHLAGIVLRKSTHEEIAFLNQKMGGIEPISEFRCHTIETQGRIYFVVAPHLDLGENSYLDGENSLFD